MFIKLQTHLFQLTISKRIVDVGSIFNAYLGENADKKVRRLSINSAIFGFIIHLLICLLFQLDLIDLNSETSKLFDSYLDSLYTPFSIFLAYEVYELIRTIPESFSNAIGKQFEIITLLVVRDILKRLSDIDASAISTIDESIGILAIECLAFVVLFATALFFNRSKREVNDEEHGNEELHRFILRKKQLAIILLFVYLAIAVYSISSWSYGVFNGNGSTNRTIFFLDFFTALILADILILLISYQYITEFSNLARNTGFILSTVILRVAIASPGVSGAIMFILAGFLGSIVLFSGIVFERSVTKGYSEAE